MAQEKTTGAPEPQAQSEPQTQPEPQAQSASAANKDAQTGAQDAQAEQPGAQPDTADAQLAAAQEKAEALQAQLDKTKDQLLRTAAEYDNYRKRTAKEKDAAFGDGLAHAVAALLPVLDALEMAESAQTADENYKKGVTMTLHKAADVFKKLNVEELEVLDKEFDPNTMNAVMQQPAPEGKEPGVVLQVLQKGYTHAGKVIRHATVVVSQ